jgi:hypothetical protein
VRHGALRLFFKSCFFTFSADQWLVHWARVTLTGCSLESLIRDVSEHLAASTRVFSASQLRYLGNTEDRNHNFLVKTLYYIYIRLNLPTFTVWDFGTAMQTTARVRIPSWITCLIEGIWVCRRDYTQPNYLNIREIPPRE